MDNADALKRFEAFVRRRAPDRRTPVDYLSDVRQFQRCCPKAWDTVTVQDIDDFVMHMQQAHLKPTTIKRRLAALKVYFDVLADEESQPPAGNPVHPRRHTPRLGRRLPRDLSDAEATLVWNSVTAARDRALVALMLQAGLRVGEVVSVTMDALQPASSPDAPARLRVCGKGQKERIVYLNPDALTALTVWLAQRPTVLTPTIFLNDRGQPLTASGVEWLLAGYGRQVGVHLTPHRLRHTFARRLTEAHMPVESLAKLMGHSQISTTQIYLEGADPQVRAAFEQAMHALETADPLPAQPPPPPALTAPPVVHPVAPVYPPPDDGATWACDLPPSIRQACLTYVQRRRGGWRASYQRQNTRDALNALAAFFHFVCKGQALSSVRDLTRADVQGYVDDQVARRVTGAAVRRSLGRIMGFLHDLEDQGEPIAPTIWHIRRPACAKSLPRAFSEAEAQALEALGRTWLSAVTASTARDAAWLFLLLHAGLRSCELLDLRQEDVDLAQRHMTVRAGKGNRDRVVYLTDVTAEAIGAYLALCPHPQAALLLVDEQSQPLTYSWLAYRLQRLGQAVGVAGVTPHRLRHTFATRLINAQVPITSVQKLLGHQYLSTTQVYAHVYDRTVERDYRRAMAQIESTPLVLLPASLFAHQMCQRK